jgi:MFS family permease
MGGILYSTIAVIVCSPAVGLLADHFGVRKVALVSVALFGLSFMAFSLSNGSLTLYYATWASVAVLGTGTLPITWTRAVNNWFDLRKGFALGLCLLGTGLGDRALWLASGLCGDRRAAAADRASGRAVGI